MAKIRDSLKMNVVCKEDTEEKCEYIDEDYVRDILNDIEERVNKIIKLFEIDTLSEALDELKDLSVDLY